MSNENKTRTSVAAEGQRRSKHRRFRKAALLGGLPLLLLLILGIVGLAMQDRLAALWHTTTYTMGPKRSVDDVMQAIGPAALGRLQPDLLRAGFADALPQRLRFIALKEERLLEVWGQDQEGNWRPIRRYPVQAASGGPGPKLKEGDRQVPEGHYPITFLNPNSAYHLSLRIGYPSPEDQAVAAEEGRSDLGGDIMIHGRAASIGCLAMGDPAIEEIFALTARVGVARSDILIAPFDLRRRPAEDARHWVQSRYDRLRNDLSALPAADWPAMREGDEQ